MSGFSSALKLTDLNDFIQPSQACIKPVETGLKKDVPLESGDGIGITINKSKGWKSRAKKVDDVSLAPKEPETPKPLSVTLGDCLACSGCITSAEAVLIAEQSHEKVFEVLERKKQDPNFNMIIVLSLSLQSIASIAAKYRLSMDTAAQRLAYFFTQLGVDYVLDIALARHVSLIESAREFVKAHSNTDSKQTVLSSTCPGFVCYAEKSQGNILVPMLSQVKSPQQIMGLLVKKRFDRLDPKRELQPETSQIYHITLMPCYDKKLEASRLDNRIDDQENPETPIPEVDCVITPVEVEKMLEMKNVTLSDVPNRELDRFYPQFYDSEKPAGLRSHLGSGSGGFAENIFRFVASELYGEYLKKSDDGTTFPVLSWKAIRNQDFLELKLYENGSTIENESQKVLLSFALLNGFRNIQNLVSRVKRKTCSYDYVEVSACPKGCLNGGAQLRDVPVDPAVNLPATVDPASIAFEQVAALYEKLPTEPQFGLEIPQFEMEQLHTQNRQLYEALGVDEKLVAEMRTKFAVVEKTFNILNSNW